MKTKILLIMIFGLAFLLMNNVVYAREAATENSFEYCVNEKRIINGEIITISKQKKIDLSNKVSYNYEICDDILNLVKMYDLNYDSFLNSKSVIIQTEYFGQEETNNNSRAIVGPPPIDGGGGDEYTPPNAIWEDEDGYLKIRTIAYHVNNAPNGDKIYEISANVTYKKQFLNYHEDRLIITHSNNAVVYSGNDAYINGIHHAILHTNLGVGPMPISTSLTSSYPNESSIDYRIPLINKYQNPSEGVYNFSQDLYARGNYYIVASGNTAVQVFYVHNKNLMGFPLDITVSAYGLGLTISGSSLGYTNFSANPLTLLQ